MDVITHPMSVYLNRHCSWARIENYILLETIGLSTHPYPDLSKSLLVNSAPSQRIHVVEWSMIMMHVVNYGCRAATEYKFEYTGILDMHFTHTYLFTNTYYFRDICFVLVSIMYVTLINI